MVRCSDFRRCAWPPPADGKECQACCRDPLAWAAANLHCSTGNFVSVSSRCPVLHDNLQETMAHASAPDGTWVFNNDPCESRCMRKTGPNLRSGSTMQRLSTNRNTQQTDEDTHHMWCARSHSCPCITVPVFPCAFNPKRMHPKINQQRRRA